MALELWECGRLDDWSAMSSERISLSGSSTGPPGTFDAVVAVRFRAWGARAECTVPITRGQAVTAIYGNPFRAGFAVAKFRISHHRCSIHIRQGGVMSIRTMPRFRFQAAVVA